ncbi:MAG: LysR family transcriptional regulator [Paludibacter sp.]|nr:LysR family transcriptional regulator [Paludibacter sp.]
MFDFRLKVFYTVAKRLNFTKAAEELYITQPAVSKHIQELETYFKIKLFNRNGNKINLTPAGEILLQYTGQIFNLYNSLEFELSTLKHEHSGNLRIGASTTIAQYVLPPLLASFHKKFDNIKVSLAINNTEQIEQALQNNDIDLGLIEGQSKNALFKYTEFIKDEIVLVAVANHALAKKQSISLKELPEIPLLLREPGSGTLEVIVHALKTADIKLSDLRMDMQLGSTESIKSYIMNSNCMAFVSIYSVLKELKNNELTVVDVRGLNIERKFHFIQPHGDAETLSGFFMEFARHYNFR